MGLNFEETTERRLNDHAERIRILEVKDAAQDGKIEMLCDKLDNLSNQIGAWMDFMKQAFWKIIGVGGTLFFVLFGFLIWYIQSLPR
jgi:hypothetical protein